MKKINLIRIYVLLAIFSGLGAIVSASTMLNFVGINMGSIDQKFSEVAFKARGNDFMGAIFWLNAKSIETGEVIKIGGGLNEKTCFKKVRGIYYNAQRGNRLRPLDQDTLAYFTGTSATYNNLSMSGGLYTSCSGEEYSIYGQITYHVNGDSYDSHITAGVQYNRTGNIYSGSFARSLQRFDNKYPIGYIYDDRGGGIGFVGGLGDAASYNLVIAKLNQGSGINNLFGYDATNNIISTVGGTSIIVSSTKGNAINTLMNAGVRGTVGLSFSVNTVEKNTILGNFEKKTLIFNALNINFSKLINEVRKNTENLCKGKYEGSDEYADINYFINKKIICLDFSGDTARYITINQEDRPNLKNKNIVVKNGDIRIGGGMGIDDLPVNIFIDKGNLLVANNTGNAINFDGNGYPTVAGVTKGINLKGNFIINGLIIGADKSSRKKESFKHKLFFNGKLASLNTPSYPSPGRIQQITSILNTGANNVWIGLSNVFTRECNPINGNGSDNGWTPCSNTGDRNALLPLIILDGNYKFFQQ